MPARTLDVCILHHAGERLVHRALPASPETFLTAFAPYRADLVVWVACLFPWYWLAALCARARLPFVLGPALSMTAIQGGQATNDRLHAQNMAVLLRGGRLPQADGSPAARRAPRALRRRRMPLRRQRAEWLTPIHKTPRPYHRPERGKNIASKANRTGGAERFRAPAVPQSLAVALALLAHADRLLRERARAVVKTAQPHEATPRALRRTLPGLGERLRLVLV